MQIDKQQILDLLRSKGDTQKADQAQQELPDKVDPDNSDHASLMSKIGVNLDEVKGKLGGLGNLL